MSEINSYHKSNKEDDIDKEDNINVLLTDSAIDTNYAMNFVVLPSTGGTSCFLGTTRATFQDKQVQTLFYEAYASMAIKVMHEIARTAIEKFSASRVCIIHRLGEVKVTEASVFIACSSVHRKEALQATEYLINELKAKVPIWKKEIYVDGSGESTWKENKEVFWKI